jgi:hypothetical protein
MPRRTGGRFSGFCEQEADSSRRTDSPARSDTFGTTGLPAWDRKPGIKRWTMTVNAECFNVFNIANLTDYNWALNAPNFGEATLRTANTFGTGGPRAFQFSARLRF